MQDPEFYPTILGVTIDDTVPTAFNATHALDIDLTLYAP
jgi:hypothetical protein